MRCHCYFRAVVYRFLLILLYPLSLLPLPVLYGVSELARFILFGIFRYRRDVVTDNLTQAFPEKSIVERSRIRRHFERNFCDQWIETLKLLTFSDRDLAKRFTANWDVFHQLYAEGRNTCLLVGHTFNWEWGNNASALAAQQLYACMYLPVSSTAFDRLMQRIRSRTGALMISMKALRSGLRALEGNTYIYTLAADQNPSVVEVADWYPFLNREAPFFRGPENLARRNRTAVVFGGIKKLGRGRYHMQLERVWDDASTTQPGEITAAYVQFMERQIREQPENWLWSHRRWKHRKV